MAEFFVDFLNGDDANGGTSWADAWASLHEAFANVATASGDIVRMRNAGTTTSQVVADKSLNLRGDGTADLSFTGVADWLFLASSSAYQVLIDQLILRGDSTAGSNGISIDWTGTRVSRVEVYDVAGTAFDVIGHASRCLAKGASIGYLFPANTSESSAIDCTSRGFDMWNEIVSNCLSLRCGTGFEANSSSENPSVAGSMAVGGSVGFTQDKQADQYTLWMNNAGIGQSVRSFRTDSDSDHLVHDDLVHDGTAQGVTPDETLSTGAFTDISTGDLRLTSTGLASDRLRAIVAGLVYCPGVTWDSLSTLFGDGGGSGGSTVFRRIPNVIGAG